MYNPICHQSLTKQCVTTPWPTPQFYCSAWLSMLWNIPLAQLSWLCSLTNCCALPDLLLTGQHKKLKSLDLVKALLSSN